MHVHYCAANANKSVSCSKFATRNTTHPPVLSKSFCHPSSCHQCHSFPMSLALILSVILCACAYITCPAPVCPHCETWLHHHHRVLLHSASRPECCKKSAVTCLTYASLSTSFQWTSSEHASF